MISNEQSSPTNLNPSDYSFISNSPNGKPFSCHKCQRTFNSKYNVIRHLKQYHAEKRMFKCSICGRDYKWVDSLHKHMKLHKINSIKIEQIKSPLPAPQVEDNDLEIDSGHSENDLSLDTLYQSASELGNHLIEQGFGELSQTNTENLN